MVVGWGGGGWLGYLPHSIPVDRARYASFGAPCILRSIVPTHSVLLNLFQAKEKFGDWDKESRDGGGRRRADEGGWGVRRG